MPNDNVRLAIHAASLLTFLIAVAILVGVNQLESSEALQWITIGAGLITAGLSTTKMIQDRRGGESDGTAQ